MRISVDNMPTRRKCRWCKLRARWDFIRHYSSWDERHVPVCDVHLGVALRNAGLVKLTIEQTATVTAEIRP